MAGADMIKTYDLPKEMYFVVAAEARPVGIPFGEHLTGRQWGKLSALTASDIGASIIDREGGSWAGSCWGANSSVEQCRPVAEQFQRHGSWWVPTLVRAEGWGGKHAPSMY